MPARDPDLTEYEQRIVDNVAQHGWFCSTVFDPTGKEPDFAYTVGFAETLHCPEFIVFGLPRDLMHSMLWELFRQIKAGAAPGEGRRWSDLIEGYDCVGRTVHPTNHVAEWLNSALWFWRKRLKRTEPLEAYQLVWPGAVGGLYPWDKGCDQQVRDLQTPLYLPNRGLH